jgi:hypothetical protein
MKTNSTKSLTLKIMFSLLLSKNKWLMHWIKYWYWVCIESREHYIKDYNSLLIHYFLFIFFENKLFFLIKVE